MPWGRLDDTLYDHPKVEDRLPDTLPGEGSARNEALGLWARGVSWCNRYLTDGRITRSRLLKLDGRAETIEALIDAGFLDSVPGSGPGVFQVHDFLEYNDSKDEIEARRERTREAGRRSGAARKNAQSNGTPNTPPNAEPNDSPNAQSNREPNDSPNETANGQSNDSSRARAGASRPVPSRPDPSRSGSIPAAGERAAGRGNSSKTTEPTTLASLTRSQLDAWKTFTAPEWTPFRDAWLARGFRLPPFGAADDEGETSQRARLWRIAEARPRDLGRWAAEAEPSSRPAEVIGYIFRQWNALAAETGAEPIDANVGPSRGEAAETLGAIMGKMTGGKPNGAADDDALEAFGR